MNERADYKEASPGVMQAMLELEKSARRLFTDKSLYHLVKVRASQLNGCAYCLDMHTREARKAGETEQRLYMISVWREARELFTAREMAAMEWTEALTRLSESEVSDELYGRVVAELGEAELANLTLVIIAINGWNRLGVGFGLKPQHD